MATPAPPHRLRSLYRTLLRELPPITARRTPLHGRLRDSFRAAAAAVGTHRGVVAEAEAAELARYLRAQRMYATLLERYNPSLRRETEDRVREYRCQ
ncbi:FMC1 protein family [Morchella snyderi]|nr:FMC1 protein family [Morchella snyderi]